jgi:hypothetical protein
MNIVVQSQANNQELPNAGVSLISITWILCFLNHLFHLLPVFPIGVIARHAMGIQVRGEVVNIPFRFVGGE